MSLGIGEKGLVWIKLEETVEARLEQGTKGSNKAGPDPDSPDSPKHRPPKPVQPGGQDPEESS